MSRAREHRARLKKLQGPPRKPPEPFEVALGLDGDGARQVVRWIQRDDGTSQILGPGDEQPETDRSKA